MNKIVKKFLLARDSFMPELHLLHLRQPRITYRTCGPFTKHYKRIQNFQKGYIYKNKLDKPCLTHDAPYSDSKDLAKRTVSEMVLKDKAYEIAINLKYNGC